MIIIICVQLIKTFTLARFSDFLLDRIEVTIGPVWYGPPEASLFVTYARTFTYTHLQIRSLSQLESGGQTAHLL